MSRIAAGRKNSPETTVVSLFIVLFYISFISTYRLLVVTGVLVIIYSLMVSEDRYVPRFMKPVMPFIILLLAPQAISYLLTGTLGEVDFVLVIAGKILISSILLGTVLARFSALYLVEGVLQLGLPPVFNRILALTFRYFHMLYEDIEKGRRALASRGLYERRGWSHLGVFGEWIGGFFLKSSEHGERVFRAMQARGFEGREKSDKRLPPELVIKSSLWIAVLTVVLIIDGKI
ncbi:MAG TPA: hypothetical protein GXX34_12260 [Clostridia bacterium]|nr:hypothetical protein [Clostridia bacterium]